MPLTAKTCDNAKPTAKAYKLADGGGLYLEVMPTGAKYWRCKYRFMSKEKRLAFGVYPEVSLAEARKKRENARKLLAEGTDPAFAKKEHKRQAKLTAATTFEAVAIEWASHQAERWSDDHGERIIGRLRADMFPEIGHLPVAQVRPLDILAALKKVEERGAHEVARRLLQTCNQIYRYAIVHEQAERNPAADLKGALKPYKKGHYAALDFKQLPAFLSKLEHNEARLFPHTRHAMKMMVLTFVRTGELIGAKWDEINWAEKQWEIPGERMKMKQPHIVPLSKQVIALLKELRELSTNPVYIFPSQIRSNKHMSNNTLLKALERMGYKGEATGHGFRALAMSTIKEKLGYRHEVVDRQLAHAQRNQVDAAYDRAQFLDDRRKMMQKWADYIDTIASSGQVIAMRRKAKAA